MTKQQKKQTPKGNLRSNIALAVSFSTLLLYAITTLIMYLDLQNTKKIHKLHIDPAIDCYFYKSPSSQTQFNFDIKNSGIVNAKNLSIDYYMLYYNTKNNKISSSNSDLGTPYNKIGENWKFIPTLAPMEIEKFQVDLPSPTFHFDKEEILKKLDLRQEAARAYKALIDSVDDESISIFYFRLKFYRESDSNEYKKSCIYLYEGDQILSEGQAKKKTHYDSMIRESHYYLNRLDKTAPLTPEFFN